MASLSFLFSLFFVLTALSLSHSPFLFVTGSRHRGLNSVLDTHSNNNASANSTQHHHHKWIGPIGNRVLSVDVNGSGDFKSLQAAVDAVPENNTVNVTIRISPGYYM